MDLNYNFTELLSGNDAIEKLLEMGAQPKTIISVITD